VTDYWQAVRARNVENGQRVRDTRTGYDLTLHDLSDLLLDRYNVVIDPPALSRIENGTHTPMLQHGLALSLWLQDTALQSHQSVEPPLPGMETAHARMGDPRSSEATVRSIAADRSLADLIVSAARCECPPEFDDGDLLEAIERMTGRRHQRNVIARARGLLEPGGNIVRVGPRERDDRKVATVHFTTPNRKATNE